MTTRSDITPAIQRISEYFNGTKEFYIPAYQRPYRWQIGDCDKLISDIKDHQENYDEEKDDNYFFGTVLVAKDSDTEHQTALIDGQQRTTTFMLLLKALLIKINEELTKLSDNTLDSPLKDKLQDQQKLIISMLYNLSEENSYNYKRGNYKLQKGDLKYFNESISENQDYLKDIATILTGENPEEIENDVYKIKAGTRTKRNDNKYTDFYKNFRYFWRDFCKDLEMNEVIHFTEHFLNACQVITITSYDTDQAINIFNSLNGTGLPLSAMEVIVSTTTAKAEDKKLFGERWKAIVDKEKNLPLDLNNLMTHYIFSKISELKPTTGTRNPGVRKFFDKNSQLLKDDKALTDDLENILDNANNFYSSSLGKVFSRFNGNFRPFISSYQFFDRKGKNYISYLLKLAALLEITEYGYSNSLFKGFLERINLKYSQNTISEEELIAEIKQHIAINFKREDIEESLKESGVRNSIIYLNEYLYCLEKGADFNIYGDVDIEHIMPQSGSKSDAIIKFSGFAGTDEFNEYLNKLGNKILLESKINRGISDNWFVAKKESVVTSGHGYIGSQYKIANDLANYPKDTWTKEDIEKATEKAAKRIVNFIFE